MIEVVKHCIFKGYDIQGKLKFDPYLGWIELTDKHECGYIVLCPLNEDLGFCPSCDNFLHEENKCDESVFFKEADLK